MVQYIVSKVVKGKMRQMSKNHKM